MGDFNARVGELSNRYQIGGRDIVEGRASKDKVINARGRYLMQKMNDVGMILGNGRGGMRLTILIIIPMGTR